MFWDSSIPNASTAAAGGSSTNNSSTTLLRRLWKVGRRTVLVSLTLQGIFVGLAAGGRDAYFERRWRGSHHAVLKRESYFSRARALSSDEVRCVEAWLDLMRFDVKPTGSIRDCFSPHCTLNDPLIFFDGRSEIVDGFSFLSNFFSLSDPVITSIQREETAGVVSLHVKTQTEAQVRWLPIHYTFSSVATLDLEDFGGLTAMFNSRPLSINLSSTNNDEAAAAEGAEVDNSNNEASSPTSGIQLNSKKHASSDVGGVVPIQRRKRIRSAEHRWFGGPIVSRFTHTYLNGYGDMGDLVRRWHGFVLSTAVTNSEHLLF